MRKARIRPDEVISTLKKYILADGFHIVADLEKSHGIWLYDAVSGREYLDLYENFSSTALGHNYPKLIQDEEFKQKLLRAAIENPANSDLYSVEYAEFVEKFAKFAKPDCMKYLFFVAGGAPAVENAIKTAFDWKYRKNVSSGVYVKPDDLKIIYFNNQVHFL